MKKLRGVLAGCGMISKYHLMAWNRIPEVEIIALSSRNTENARVRKDEFVPDAAIYESYIEMLENEKPDFIDILTPPAVHVDYCLEAKKKNIHIICQKPITDHLNDAEKLVCEMKDYPFLFAIHENHRYRPWFQDTCEKLKNGFFGKPRYLHLTQHNPSEPDVAYKLEMEDGVLLEHGTHLVDMIRCLLGEPEKTYASLHKVSKKIFGESLAHVIYEYPETTAVIDVAWKPGGFQQAGMVLEGEEGEAFYEGSMVRGGESRYRLAKAKTTVHDESRNAYDDYTESFYLFQKECVYAMLSGKVKEIIQTGEENLKTLRCTFAAYNSARNSKVIEI